MSRRRLLTATLIAAAAIWCATIAMAFEAIRRFETTPGAAADARQSWPAATHLARTPGKWSLVMLVHPHCSCSRASVSELEEIIKASPRELRTTILVFRPGDAKPGWERSDVFASATRVRGAHVVIDTDGAEAGAFGGFTSGQTFLYDGDGRLRFSGGITSLRGHSGLNAGRADVIRLARRGEGKASHPVFGCAISTKKGTTR